MTRLPRELPADREKALEAIANGWTRQPTHAHPDCICMVSETHIVWVGCWWDDNRPQAQARRPQPKRPCPIHGARRR